MGLVLLTALMFTFNRPLENSREIGLNEVVELARSSTPNSKLLIEINKEFEVWATAPSDFRLN